jgi:hypothetical protein
MGRWLAALLCLISPLFAEIPVKFVLAPEFILGEGAADALLPDKAALQEALRRKASQAFPGAVVQLSTEVRISPNERVLVLVPTLHIGRLTHEVTAGVIDHYEAVVVGDLSLLDPWTNATLFSATRMVAATVDLGRSQAARRDELLRQAYETATTRWMDVCLAQVKEHGTPFVLDGLTLTSPDSGLKGGIWPFGRERGVKQGDSLRGPGHFARVQYAEPKYAVIQDVADPKRKLPAGEPYSLTVVDRPTERPEPTVALAWRGAPPRNINNGALHTIDADAFLALLGDYLSKAGGLRLLPGEPKRTAAKDQFQRLHDYIARYSDLSEGNFLSSDQAVTAREALQKPDRRVDLGVLGTYHGTRRKADGSLEHFYRLHLGVAIFVREGEGEAACYPMHGFLEQSEEMAQVEKEGIRELDRDAAWFTVCRNAVIHLAEKVQGHLLAIPAGDSRLSAGVIDAGRRPQWQGPAPDEHKPLLWFRPSGDVKDASGRPLGPLMLPQAFSKGFLNLSILREEKVRPGDVLFFSGSAEANPLLSLNTPVVDGAPDWVPEPLWLAPMVAQALMAPGGCRFQLPETREEKQPRMKLQASNLGMNATGAVTTFTGQWRVRLQVGPDSQEPRLKFGIQTDHSRSLDKPAEALSPLDTGAWAMDFIRDTLDRLAESAAKKHFNQAVMATQQELP